MTGNTRVGKMTFSISHLRKGNFYPHGLGKDMRVEKALLLAQADMYVQGVSTKKVTAITEILCATSISANQVNRAAKKLDEKLKAWRNQPLGETPHQMHAMKKVSKPVA